MSIRYKNYELYLSFLWIIFLLISCSLDTEDKVKPNGQTAVALQSQILDIVKASDGLLDLNSCRMIEKNYVVVICEAKRIKQEQLKNFLNSQAWAKSVSSTEDIQVFTKNADRLTVEQRKNKFSISIRRSI